MRLTFFFLLFLALGAREALGQEIIPFPNIGDSRLAAVNQTELIDDHNYSLYTQEYQEALLRVDTDIDLVKKALQKEEDPTSKDRLEDKINDLEKKRSQLLQEADLIEDLSKFY